MKLEVSDKEASYTKPQIDKGYYAGRLQRIKRRTDENGDDFVHPKYKAKHLIFLFQIYEKDGTPVKNPEKEEEILVLPQMVFDQYQNDDGSFRTAVTKNSKITKVFEALGWDFNSDKELDTDKYVGNWVELNIDDYTKETDNGEVTFSVIKDINELKEKEKKKVKKVVEGEDYSNEEKKENKEKSESKVEEEKVEGSDDTEEKFEEMKKMYKEDLISTDGFKKSIEKLHDQGKISDEKYEEEKKKLEE